MAEGYWKYADPIYHPVAMAPPPSAAGHVGGGGGAMAPAPVSVSVKRPRPDYGGGPELHSYYPHEEERNAYSMVRDAESLGASYDRYLRNGQMSSYGAGDPVRLMPTSGRPADDARMVSASAIDGRNVGYGGGRMEAPLPRDASNTLYVEGLPASCTRREVAHIFRPFVGFREVRLVTKESRYPGGEPLVLCFVDFSTPSQATAALDALQGYKFDEHDRDSANLRLQFARFPGPRSNAGPRSRR